MAIMATTSFRKLYADQVPFLEELIINVGEEWPELYSQVTKVGNTDRIKETDLMIAPYGLFDPFPEGTDLRTDELTESYQKDFTMAGFAKGIAVTKHALRFDRNALMAERAVGLGMSARQTVEQIVWNACYGNGFTTSFSADGVPIFGTHTLTRGGTVVNATSGDLDLGALEDAIAHFPDLYDEAGKRVTMEPYALIVGIANEANARRLLNSMYLPGTDRNDVNDYVQSRNLKLIVAPWLPSPTMWFVIAAPRMLKAKVYWAWRPELDTDVDFLSKSGMTSLDFCVGAGVSDWRGLYGSSGA